MLSSDRAAEISIQPLRVRLITTELEWDSIRAQWNTLYAVSTAAVMSLSFDWLRSWWRTYGDEYGQLGLRILSWWRGSSLVGLLPLYEKRGLYGARELRFISTGEAEYEETCPDYMNLICAPGEEAACADAAWSEIQRLEWDRLELLDLPAEAALTRSGRLLTAARIVPRGRCPTADLTGGFETYLGRLSANTRSQSRRMMRNGTKAGVRFEFATRESAPAFFDELAALHRSRWTARGKPGAFSGERFLTFHRTLLSMWISDGRAILARLSLGSAPLAVLYGFVHGRVFSFYQAGVRVDEALPIPSPGNLAHLMLMKELAERSFTTYDFLRGTAIYKERLACGANALMGVYCWHTSVRARTRRALVILDKVVRRGKLAMRNKEP
jgi:CelD/BcsL family acetyltransferase involved in cellulose biosynthesis